MDVDDLLGQARVARDAGELARALELCSQALAIDSRSGAAIDLCHAIFVAGGRQEEARALEVTAYQEGIDARLTLPHFAREAEQQGDWAKACALWARAQEDDPSDVKAALALAVGRHRQGDLAGAEAAMQRFATEAPNTTSTVLTAGAFFAAHGMPEAARAQAARFETLAEPGPERDHRLAALRGEAPLDQPDPSYIAGIFDTSAPDYDETLNSLQNQGPQLVARMIAALQPQGVVRALDAGCGTGLCAETLRGVAQHVTGVDLSRKMLDLAAQTGLYDSLLQADLTALPPDLSQFDLIISSDVLTYLGDLAPVMGSLASRLSPQGVMILGITAAPDAGPNITIEPSGRYAHRATYLLEVARGLGLGDLQMQINAPIRHEYGRPVQGHLFALSWG